MPFGAVGIVEQEQQIAAFVRRIFGAHFDVFSGSKALAKKANQPSRAHIWFEGVEDRLPMDYAYGL